MLLFIKDLRPPAGAFASFLNFNNPGAMFYSLWLSFCCIFITGTQKYDFICKTFKPIHMKSRFLLFLATAAAISSCSSAYKSGQTPDDVYYSPARGAEEYVETRQDDNRRYRNYEVETSEDRWLRMRVRNPYRWNSFDDYDWNIHNSWTRNTYSPYSYNWNSYWNRYWTWNSFYNPYCTNIVVVNPKGNAPVYNKVRNFSLGSYTNTNYNNSNNTTNFRSKTNTGVVRPSATGSGYNNGNSNSVGSSLRRVFSSETGTNSYQPTGSRESRSYTPSNSGGSSGSSSGSSGRSSSSGGSSGGGGSTSGGSSGRRGG